MTTNNHSNESQTKTRNQEKQQLQLRHERGHSVPNLPHHSNGNTWADVVSQSLPQTVTTSQFTSSPVLYSQYSIGSDGTTYHHPVYPGTAANVSMMPYQMYHPTMVSGYTYYPSYYYHPYHQPMPPQSISSMPSTPYYPHHHHHPQSPHHHNYYNNTSHTDYSNEEYDNQQHYVILFK